MGANIANAVAAWWNTPGVSEFVSAIVGAIIGSLSAGIISWQLQRASFRKDKSERAEERRATERALLLQTLYSCLQAASDLHKLAEEAEQAKLRATHLASLQVHGLSNTWAALNAQATLPEPVSILPQALTVFVDHKAADLVMGVLDVVAVHNSTLKLWALFGESRRRFGEKVSVKVDGGVTYTPLSAEQIEAHYAHLKELSDLAEGICGTSAEYAAEAKGLVTRLQKFIADTAGTRLDIAFPENPAPSKDQNDLSTR